MKDKKLNSLRLGVFIIVVAAAALLVKAGLTLYQESKLTHSLNLSQWEWAGAETIFQEGIWCPANPAHDRAGDHLNILFANNESINFTVADNGTATIHLVPEILQASLGLQEMFTNFVLYEGFTLYIYLENGGHVEIFVCDQKIFFSVGK